MLSGLTAHERDQLALTNALDYEYLRKGGCITCDGRDDAVEFSNIRSACKVLTFSDDEIWNIMKILAAILHIGNIKYKATSIRNLDATEIVNRKVVDSVAALLQVCLYLLLSVFSPEQSALLLVLGQRPDYCINNKNNIHERRNCDVHSGRASVDRCSRCIRERNLRSLVHLDC
jgi:Myosin head (motor domain)